jgi:hypothetical protein
MNLTDELEMSFVDEPAHRPVEQTVAAGRRLVVRRRLATGAGATAAALVVGGTAFALAGGGSPSAVPESRFATTPTSSPEAADPPVDAGGRDHDPEWGREAAYLGTDGNLRIKPGWTIAEQIDEPLGPGSVAVEVAHGGKRQWFLWDGEGGEVIALGRPAEDGAPDPDYASFAGWVADISNADTQPNDEGRR